MENVAAVLGLFVFTGIAFLFSTNKKAVNWKTIAWAFGLQVIFAVLILKTSVGITVFDWLNDKACKEPGTKRT